jgi:hypothetical protein
LSSHGRIKRNRTPGVRALALAVGALAYTACATTQVSKARAKYPPAVSAQASSSARL